MFTRSKLWPGQQKELIHASKIVRVFNACLAIAGCRQAVVLQFRCGRKYSPIPALRYHAVLVPADKLKSLQYRSFHPGKPATTQVSGVICNIVADQVMDREVKFVLLCHLHDELMEMDDIENEIAERIAVVIEAHAVRFWKP